MEITEFGLLMCAHLIVKTVFVRTVTVVKGQGEVFVLLTAVLVNNFLSNHRYVLDHFFIIQILPAARFARIDSESKGKAYSVEVDGLIDRFKSFVGCDGLVALLEHYIAFYGRISDNHYRNEDGEA